MAVDFSLVNLLKHFVNVRQVTQLLHLLEIEVASCLMFLLSVNDITLIKTPES